MTNRRQLLQGTAALGAAALSGVARAADSPDGLPGELHGAALMKNGVRLAHIRFHNRFDTLLAANVYLPPNFNPKQAYRAVIVGHPFGAVKEQPPAVYGPELAARGIVALAMDLSYGGESGGEPRLTVSPDAYVEDFSAAVDYLGTRAWVSPSAIGVLGICGSGGFAVCAASIDPRIAAVATVSMYDMGRATRQGLRDSMTKAQRHALLEQVAEQRYREFLGEAPRIRFGTPEKLPPDAGDVAKAFYAYYRTERGYHPRYQGTRFTSIAQLMTFHPFAQIEDISPRPVLFIVGERAHSRYFSEDACQKALEPKELYIVPNAGHVDLYDSVSIIPFDKLEEFFKRNLPLKA